MKSSNDSQHLTDAEFSNLLAGELADGATRLHLASCDYCRNELANVKESLASFSGLGTRWAQAVAPQVVPVPSRWARNVSLLPSWTTGLGVTAFTGLLVFSFGPAHFAHLRSAPVPVAQTVTAAVPNNTQLADDNRLMLSIDQELGYQARPAQAVDGSTTANPKLDHTASDAVID